ncbi:hypothetical protein B0H16DRAFT_1741303 [Mycena metata]|uniref:Uncharacterized protein n=1 Tax=Mycena metata TaxID=1033252 RepID=A0AAD7HB13_9AGAR|nr:hypothetical protein B0H16DRAFT_1741303 [Mycena metata]
MATDIPAAANNISESSSPPTELDSLISLAQAMSQMSLRMANFCLDLQTRLPNAVDAAVEAAVDAALAATAPDVPAAADIVWACLTPPTPAELEAQHPPGIWDDVAYHVVTSGREPNLYLSTTESDDQVLGVPHAHRRRVVGRTAALAYYRAKYNAQEAGRWAQVSATDAGATAAAPSAAAPVAAAALSTAAPAAAAASSSHSAYYRAHHRGIEVSVTIG